MWETQPNKALHRIAALLRFCLRLKVHSRAARGELGALGVTTPYERNQLYQL